MGLRSGQICIYCQERAISLSQSVPQWPREIDSIIIPVSLRFSAAQKNEVTGLRSHSKSRTQNPDPLVLDLWFSTTAACWWGLEGGGSVCHHSMGVCT